MPSKTEWAWLAGIIDGDGWIGVYPDRGVPDRKFVVGLSQPSDEHLLRVVKGCFGGHISRGELKWQSKKECARVVQGMLPFLRQRMKVLRAHLLLQKVGAHA